MGNLNTLQTNTRQGSGLVGQPLGFNANFVDIQQAMALDENALFGLNSGVSADIQTTALTAPGVTITQGGTAASTNYTYVVADTSNLGAAPTSLQTTTGPVTLSTTNYNIVAFATTLNHVYNVFRSASSGTPSTTGLLATFIGTGGLLSFNDTGAISPASAPEIPTGNTTGGLQLPGPANVAIAFSGGGSAGLGGKQVVTGAGNVTWTAAQFLADIAVRTGSTAPTDPSPTAQALVAAAGPAIRAGAIHTLIVRNEGGGTWTLSAGTGVTLRAGNTNTVVTVASKTFTIVFTTITPGSEAVEVISGATSVY